MRGDKIEPRRGRIPGPQIGVLPGDSGSEVGARRVGMPSRPVQGNLGHVNGGDLPAVRRQPDRVRPLPTADVQGRARSAIGDVLDQALVGLPAPERLGRPVPLVPELLSEHHVDIGQLVLMCHAITLPQILGPRDGFSRRVTDSPTE